MVLFYQDKLLSADFFNYANEINPKNKKVFNLAIMSLVMSGEIDAAISKIKYHEKNFGEDYHNSVISNFIVFINKVKNNKKEEALKHLNESKEFLIT